MRNPARSAGKVFGTITQDELNEQIAGLVSRKAEILAAAPESVRPRLQQRIESMESTLDLTSEQDRKRAIPETASDELHVQMTPPACFPVAPRQSESLTWYTGRGYDSINKALRDNPDYPQFASDKDRYAFRNVTQLIDQAGTSDEPITVFRARRSKAAIAAAEEYLAAGTIVPMPGFSSASIDSTIANDRFGDVIYEVKARTGAYFAGLHGRPGIKLAYEDREREFLQKHNTKYVVVGVLRDVPAWKVNRGYGEGDTKTVVVIQMVEVIE